MSDFTDPNGQIPFDTGNTDVPQASQSVQSSQSESSMPSPTAQQYMQNQQYDQPYQQPIQSQPAQSQSAQPQPVPPQSMQPDYGQASPSAQYGQPAYSQTPQYASQSQYAQMPQYGQQQPQYDRTQPAYGQAQSQYNQAQPQYGQPYTQQYGQYGQQQTGYDQQAYRQMPNYQTTPQPAYGGQQKSKLAAGLFGIFLGALGVHNFYLGFTGKAIAQLLLSLIGWVLFGLGPVVAGIWGLVEGILILCSTYGSNWHRDAKGIELTD